MKDIINFLFFRWEKKIIKRGTEIWIYNINGIQLGSSEHRRDYVDYKLTNKYNGSEKIKRVYLN